MRLLLEWVYPPIPIRTCDWCVSDYDNPEGPQGFGSTPLEALEDYAEWYSIQNDSSLEEVES